MKKLNNNELSNVKGGFSALTLISIFAAATFIIGIVEGITKPDSCEE